ncbi:MAG: DnaJ domain-containing protein [Oscillospiraceae bacterium]|jgi:curved DNA-binding protein CbpA|nr:DnaJ domain-containing protein [Oscillospiraceae bacterium]
MNHYDFFGINRDATDDEIKNAYKRMAKKYHPDVSEGCAGIAHEKMQRINEIYGILSDNALREEYDYCLWAEEREYAKANYAHEFRDFVPQGTRTNPGSTQTAWQKFYGKETKLGNFFRKGGSGKMKSKKAAKIMAVVWTLRIIIPTILLIIVFGIVLSAPFMADWLDNNVYRGSPARITGAYIDSIKEHNFERSERLVTGSGMSNMTREIMSTYRFEADGIPYGEFWFENAMNNLAFIIIRTERAGFGNANMIIKITNLNIENIFTLTELAIKNDINSGTPKPILRRAVEEQDLSLITEVYGIYYNEMAAIHKEYLTAEIKLGFFRGGSMWQISGADDTGLLKNVILGGFGEASRVGFKEYTQIDWYRELGIERE